MPNSIKRRDFIKTISVLGTSVALTSHKAAGAFFQTSGRPEIKNNFFSVEFDEKKGLVNIYRKSGFPLLEGGTICANLKTEKRLIVSGAYKHSFNTIAFNDPIGPGKRLIILSVDSERKIDFETQISIYDSFQSLTIETICKNASGQDLFLSSLEPIRTVKDEGGILHVPGVEKCITNGEMYYDAGMIYNFSTGNNPASLDYVKGVKLANKTVSSHHSNIHSWWNTGFFCGYENEGVSIGYLENDKCLGNLLVARTDPGQISFLAESVYSPEIILKPGQTLRSNRVMINIASDPYRALENYADAVGKINNARTCSVLNGWCSWFYTMAWVSEAEVIANTVFAATHLKPYGLQYIQVDEGYQKWHGEWEGNDRFPHGMKWLADQIKSYGLKPGIWISPYVISEYAEVFKQHPDWMLKRADGSLQRVGNWDEGAEPPKDENPKRYCLDITNPEAAKWMYNLIDTIVNDWGYELIKIDFVAWSILAAERYYDSTLSAAAVYNKGMEIMRKAAGEKCHILECGPGNTAVGLIDSMRIEVDAFYGYRDINWLTYFVHPACSASALGKRYYFHKRTWVNDVDHVCMDLLNNRQSEAAATIIAMSGGNLFSGDRLTQLDSYKLNVFQKVTPSFGETAFPVDLFDTDMQSVFALNIKKPFAEWTVAAFFNASLTEKTEKKISLRRLRLDPLKTYLVFDFWKQEFLGEMTGEIAVTIEPGSVTLLSLHEKTGKPQFISTDRHVMQGALEIQDTDWDENSKTYSGISTGPLGTSHNVFVYVPEAHPWTWSGEYVLFNDYESYSLRMIHPNIVRVHVSFEKSEPVSWKINYTDFF